MRTNEISKTKKITLFIAAAIMSVLGCGVVSAQPCPCSVSAQTGERLPAGFYPKGSPEYEVHGATVRSSSTSKSSFITSKTTAEMTYGVVVAPAKSITYLGNSIKYTPQTSVNGSSIVNPYEVLVSLEIPKGESVNITYSLYTYKPTFKQGDGRRYDPPYVTSPSYGATQDCSAGITFSTQKDIDDNLDLIYEFAPIRETESGLRIMHWDGKTSDGQAVRDCVLVAAQDKDTGQILNVRGSLGATQGYETRSRPGVKYTPIQGAVRAEITLAYVKPVRRMWAILGDAACKFGAKSLTFDIVNEGAEAIAEILNEDFIKHALAVKELINPAKELEKPRLAEDGLVKIFTWDIQDVRPPDGEGALMIIVIEADDGQGNIVPTVTGLNDGYIFADNSNILPFPMQLPGVYTSINNPAADDGIKISYMSDGFTITGGSEGWVIRTVTGLQIAAGKGAFVPKNGLPKGIYLLTVANTQGVKETQKIIVR